MNSTAALFKDVHSEGCLEILEIVRAFPGSSAYDIIDIYESLNGTPDRAQEVFRFAQNVHGRCSEMVKDGRLVRKGMKKNPATDRPVYTYEIAGAANIASPKVDKGYKAKYLELLEENESLNAYVATLKTQLADTQRKLDNELNNN
jgi:hypothetical protein